jgi:excisionase family DNA binding protein
MGGMLITPEEAASQLAIGRTKVYELIRQGKLESVRIGTCRRIPVQSLRSYVAELLRLETDVPGPSTERPFFSGELRHDGSEGQLSPRRAR